MLQYRYLQFGLAYLVMSIWLESSIVWEVMYFPLDPQMLKFWQRGQQQPRSRKAKSRTLEREEFCSTLRHTPMPKVAGFCQASSQPPLGQQGLRGQTGARMSCRESDRDGPGGKWHVLVRHAPSGISGPQIPRARGGLRIPFKTCAFDYGNGMNDSIR